MCRTLCLILESLLNLTNKVDQLMATVASLTQDLTDLKAAVDTERQQAADRQTAVLAQIDSQTAEIQRLNDLIAAGGVATQADLDALAVSIAETRTAVTQIIPDA